MKSIVIPLAVFGCGLFAAAAGTNPIATHALTLQITGEGKVHGLTNGQILVLGRKYPVSAVAAAGWILENWTDSQGNILSELPAFSFLDTPDGALAANFVNNPFPPFKGTYRGLFLDADDGVESTNSGFLQLTMNGRGIFSGKILFGTNACSFASRLFATYGEPQSDDIPVGEFRVNLKQGGVLDVTLQLENDTNLLDPGAGAISGAVSAYTDATESTLLWTAPLYAERSALPPNPPTPGLYNLGIGPVSLFDPSTGPGGYSYGALRVNKGGAIAMTVHLADGSPKISLSSETAWDRNFPVFTPLYHGNGIFIGWFNFTNNTHLFENLNLQIEADYLAWSKLPGSGVTYTNGFTTGSASLQSYGSLYEAPRAGSNIWSNTNLLFQVNYNTQIQTNALPVTFNPRKGLMTVPSPNPIGLTIAFDPATGDFQGNFLPDNDNRRCSFQGNLMPPFQQGWGFYVNTNQQTVAVSLYGR